MSYPARGPGQRPGIDGKAKGRGRPTLRMLRVPLVQRRPRR